MLWEAGPGAGWEGGFFGTNRQLNPSKSDFGFRFFSIWHAAMLYIELFLDRPFLFSTT
jgi:hypothetical protein